MRLLIDTNGVQFRAVVHGLVFAPWVGRDGKIKRAFRAQSVEPSGPAKSAQAA